LILFHLPDANRGTRPSHDGLATGWCRACDRL
jgi:hypothetical protein